MILDNGAIISVNKVEARAPVRKIFPLPFDLLELARWAGGLAAQPAGDHRSTVLCVTLVAAAAEGILNSILEPLVLPEEWEKTNGRGLNWMPVPKKWIKLTERLRMRPQLDVEKPPLSELLKVFDLRNQILHFNLSPNIEEVDLPLKADYERGRLSVSLDPNVDTKKLLEGDFGLKAQLHPSLAAGYYLAIVNVLREVLPYCARDPFGFIASIERLVTNTSDAG